MRKPRNKGGAGAVRTFSASQRLALEFVHLSPLAKSCQGGLQRLEAASTAAAASSRWNIAARCFEGSQGIHPLDYDP
ncbi:MAG: hypothetical protein L0387_28505 [Acidobacteria bacterium]|nr:hypothetical protein [Acidobacteriota bacterium]